MKIKQSDLYSILVGVFVGCLLISNILASKTFVVFAQTLPAAVIIFPAVYIVNDVLTEVYGYRKAGRAIRTGFFMNMIAAAAYIAAIALPPSSFYEGQAAFTTVLSSSWRILTASLSAYLIGSLLNAFVMDKMSKGKSLFVRCIVSTLVGETVDSTLFLSIAFIGLRSQ